MSTRCNTAAALCDSQNAFACDVLRGLQRTPKRVSSRWFYDARGSELFQRITETEEYYLTRSEHEILCAHGAEIACRIPGRVRVIELGAGDGGKTEVLLRAFLAEKETCHYIPIDICADALTGLSRRLATALGDAALRVRPVVDDWRAAIHRLDRAPGVTDVVLFLGSSIGNLGPRQSQRLLVDLAAALRPGDYALIGFDLKKSPEILRRAYDDRDGVTREFNFNLLDRINRELGGDFRRARFQHHCHYNPARERMESWLLSVVAHEVQIAALGRRFAFAAWEGLHLECSYKYDLRQIEEMASAADFQVVTHYCDARGHFCDSLWRARPRHSSLPRKPR